MGLTLTILSSAFLGSVAGEVAEATTGSLEGSVLTQVGVFAVCLVIGWFMLRRSDQRDQSAQDYHVKIQTQLLLAKDELILSLRAEIVDLRSRIEHLEAGA